MLELYQIEHPVDTDRFIYGLKLSLTKLACNEMVEKTVPITVFVVLAATMYSAFRLFKKQDLFGDDSAQYYEHLYAAFASLEQLGHCMVLLHL